MGEPAIVTVAGLNLAEHDSARLRMRGRRCRLSGVGEQPTGGSQVVGHGP